MPETQARRRTSDILERIIVSKRAEVAGLLDHAAELSRGASQAPPRRDFAGALRGDTVAVIAEVKRRSPGAGDIAPDLDAGSHAAAYEAGGAAALSVLTDGPWFGGSLADLASARAATSIPCLRKDFVIDPVQIAEARAAGADAVLLIVRALDDVRLAELLAAADEHGLAALVEVHDRAELERALDAGARIVGVNNRDLRSFRTDVAVTLALAPHVPPTLTLVSESGVRSRADVERLGWAGVDAVLVGEAVAREADPGAAVARLQGCARSGRSA